ncbi:MAG: hypothetical protein WAM60_10155 [Candidatus Promineifilaceae bacterium]
MTPTLFGRIQTRLLLLGTVGAVVTFFYGILAAILTGTAFGFFIPFILLFLVATFGIIWDILYNFAQKFRWDHDWPPAFSFITAFIEMLPIMFIALLLNVHPVLFLFHYWTVWWTTFIMALGPMRVIFPRWRFRGGQWL